MKEIIETLEEQLRLAMTSNDVAELKKLVHDELQFSIPTGDIISKDFDIEGYKKSEKNFESIIFNSQIIKELGDGVVTITSATIRGNYLDMDISGNYSYLRVWVRSGASWQVIAGQVSVLPENK